MFAARTVFVLEKYTNILVQKSNSVNNSNTFFLVPGMNNAKVEYKYKKRNSKFG